LASQPSKSPSANGIPRQPTWFTRRRLLLLGLLVFIVGGVAAALDIRFVTGGTPRPVLPRSQLVLDPRTMATIRNYPGPPAGPPPYIARGAGLIWTVDGKTNKLIGRRLDPSRVVRSVTVGTEPVAVATGFGSAWVANSGNGTITRVALRGPRVETLGLSDQPSAIATGANYVWVLSERSKKVIRIDPSTNLITKKIRLSRAPIRVSAAKRRVLVTIGE
jgi:DNA-binding beta-propeller fold protein YncE